MNATTLTIPTLETARLTLRAPDMRDFAAFARFCASDGMEFMGGPIAEDQAFRFLSSLIGHWHLRGFGRWIVADKVSNDAIGLVGLIHMQEWAGPEIGWLVFTEGQGIATEASLATLDYAYDVLGWDHVDCMIHPDNTRSLAMVARLGFDATGQVDDPKDGPLLTFSHRRARVAAR